MTDKPPGKGPKAEDGAAAGADRKNTASGRSGKRSTAALKLNPAFDSWLERKLHTIFDAATAEPLPPDLLNLLEKIDRADAAQVDKKKE